MNSDKIAGIVKLRLARNKLISLYSSSEGPGGSVEKKS